MIAIVLIVFLGVFGVVVLVAAASGTGSADQTRAIMTRLESAIAIGKPEMADLIVDVRKNELMSSIPWLDRYLSKLELAPRIRRFPLPGRYQVDGWRDCACCAPPASSFRATSSITAPGHFSSAS